MVAELFMMADDEKIRPFSSLQGILYHTFLIFLKSWHMRKLTSEGINARWFQQTEAFSLRMAFGIIA